MTNQITSSENARSGGGTVFCEPEDVTIEAVQRLAKSCSQLLVKKLAMNDWQWAVRSATHGGTKSHQGGPLLPQAARDSGFFPELLADHARPHNWASAIKVFWPRTGKIFESRFVWYSKKGAAENHLTRNPASEFSELGPASFLLMFRTIGSSTITALTVSSADEELVSFLVDMLRIGPDFRFGVFEPTQLQLEPEKAALQLFVEQILEAARLGKGQLVDLLGAATKKNSAQLADEAFTMWCRENGRTGSDALNPYELDRPGDTLHELSRIREFELYKREESRIHGARLVAKLLELTGGVLTPESIISACVTRYDEFFSTFKSAAQARVSRAGSSFELHMAKMLRAGGVPFDAQVVFGGGRPDFILPSKEVYRNKATRGNLGIVFPLKTTLRERWRQVASETTGCPIYLGTMDESVPGPTLDKLRDGGIFLVVPERFKTSICSDYQGRSEVLSYRCFFDQLKDLKLMPWRAAGVPCF